MPNNREIATAVWLSIVFLWLGLAPSVRSSVVGLARLLFSPLVAIPLSLLAVHTITVSYVASRFGFWDWTLLTDTAIWIALSGTVIVWRAATAESAPSVLRSALLPALGVGVLVETLMSLHTFLSRPSLCSSRLSRSSPWYH